MKTGSCYACHQIGNKATREIPKDARHVRFIGRGLGRGACSRDRPAATWSAAANQFGKPRVMAMFADWTDRIANGRAAAGAAPPPGRRAQRRHHAVGLGRSARPTSTTRSRPTGAIRRVNANGPIYGSLELSSDYMPVLDPMRHTASKVPLTVRDPNTPRDAAPAMPQPSPYWGEEVIWTSKANVHNPMMDQRGPRAGSRRTVRPPENPASARQGSNHPSAKLFPINNSWPASRRCTIRKRRSSRTSARASARTT